MSNIKRLTTKTEMEGVDAIRTALSLAYERRMVALHKSLIVLDHSRYPAGYVEIDGFSANEVSL